MTKDEQVDHIIRLMLDGKWHGAQTNQELSAEWKCHPRTVSDRACEASAALKRIGGSIEDLVVRKFAELEAIQVACMRKTKHVVMKTGPDTSEVVEVPDPDHATAVKTIELQLKAKGALVQKVERTDKPATLTDDELRARLRAALHDSEQGERKH